jgi:predicted nucleotidyltransferase
MGVNTEMLLGTSRGLKGSAVVPHGLDKSVGEALPLAVQRLVEKLHPEKIILFGSYAYGTPTPDSDVDLLVILQTIKKETDRSWAVSKLLLPRPFPVDILVKTPEEIEKALQVHDPFISEIIKRGRVLYERA